MGKVISFFNNKGGVGKTTTSCNMAAALSQKQEKTVLYIDLDPQCNSTLLILGEETVSQSYWQTSGKTKTILDVVEPLLIDDPTIFFDETVINSLGNRFSIDVVMGHPKLSLIEDRLGEAWGKVPGGDVGALRKSNWCSDFISKVRDNYDFILIDLGPSLGSLNRSALIASDYFVTPMSIDVFSLIGLKNISEWLAEWSTKYERGIQNLLASSGEAHLQRFQIKRNLEIKKGFIGYTTQSYIAKTNKDGTKRATKAFELFRQRFDAEFDTLLGSYKKPGLESEDLILGEIPNLYSLAPLAQAKSAPIRDLTASDGIFGRHYTQVEDFTDIFDAAAEKLSENVEDGE